MCQNLLNELKNKEGFFQQSAASLESIEKAEKLLNLQFNEEYKKYLLEYGCVFYDGHELTGISNIKRLNVVDVTLEQLPLIKNPNQISLYVIEELHIDDLVIWQSTDGKIYETVPDDEPKLIYNSFLEYIVNEE